jgi:catechol 2,3-dioxygenase-like lactoylglutathione lyase family enzyme
MRDFRDAKRMAKSLRAAMADRQVPLSHSETLEIVARQFGCDDWNVLAAKIDGATPGTNEDKPQEVVRLQMGIPILRIFDEAKATEFYLGFLGFRPDWEHRFAPGLPLYMQISRSGLILHLSEHHGDASPGSTVFVWMDGIEAFHGELAGKRYSYSRPGIQRDGPGGPTLEVPDPFGNRIRFCEKPR